MALSGKYGKLNIPPIGSDEPVFILRGQDRLSAAVLAVYRVMLETHNSPLAAGMQKEIDAFNGWTGPRKIPD
jgi:hypothetical protein